MAFSPLSLDLSFRDSAHMRTESHSFANIINVVHAELQLLERMCKPHADLRPLVRLCETAARAFKSAEVARANSRELAHLKDRVMTLTSELTARPEYRTDAEDAVRLITEVIDDAELRIYETLARYGTGFAVRTFSPDEFAASVQSGGHATIRVTTPTNVPVGLPPALGRFAREIATLGAGPVTISASGGPRQTAEAARGVPGSPGDRTVVDVQVRDPPEALVVPSTWPQSFKSDKPEDRMPAIVALLYYMTRPNGELRMNDEGERVIRLLF